MAHSKLEGRQDLLDPERLAQGSVFGALSREAIDYLVANGNIVTMCKSEILFDIDDPGDSFFIVCDGEVDFYRHCGSEFRRLRTLGFGDEVGLVAMIALQNRSGRVVAHSDCVLLEISSSLFARLHGDYPTDFGVLLLNLTRDLARLVRKLDEDLLRAEPV